MRLGLHLVLGAFEEETERAKHVHLLVLVLHDAHLVIAVRVDDVLLLLADTVLRRRQAIRSHGLGPFHDQLDVLLVLLLR